LKAAPVAAFFKEYNHTMKQFLYAGTLILLIAAFGVSSKKEDKIVSYWRFPPCANMNPTGRH